MSYESLNHGDVFILDDGKTIYCWNGMDSSKRERVKVSLQYGGITCNIIIKLSLPAYHLYSQEIPN